jgi:hypothetical protein
MAALFIIVVGLLARQAVFACVVDVTQTEHAIRRNYPGEIVNRFSAPSPPVVHDGRTRRGTA